MSNVGNGESVFCSVKLKQTQEILKYTAYKIICNGI